MDTVYIETSIVSHATAWPSSDIQIAAVQHQAREWWASERQNFELVTSQLVIDEAAAGDPAAATERLKLLEDLPIVAIDDDVRSLARAIVSASLMPQKLLLMHFTLLPPLSQEYNICLLSTANILRMPMSCRGFTVCSMSTVLGNC